MSIKKNKNIIIEKITSVDNQFIMEDWYNRDYFDDYDYEIDDYVYVYVVFNPNYWLQGRMIDPDTYYDITTLRNNKIEKLLGNHKTIFTHLLENLNKC